MNNTQTVSPTTMDPNTNTAKTTTPHKGHTTTMEGENLQVHKNSPLGDPPDQQMDCEEQSEDITMETESTTRSTCLEEEVS